MGGISSDFKINLTASRTRQLSDAMTVSKDLMSSLQLAAAAEAASVQEVVAPIVNLPTGTARRNGMVGVYLDWWPVFVPHITALSYGIEPVNSMLHVYF